MTKKVIIPRGIPGAGKTTWVKDQLSKHTPGTAVRISNDDLSAMLFGQPWGTFFSSDTIRESLHNLRINMLRTLLKQDGIETVYVDNTNLAMRTVRSLEKVAQAEGAEFVVIDDFLNVSLNECIERDAKRENPVGADVIRKMHKDAVKLKPWNYLPKHEPIPHVHHDNLPKAIIVDIDGTLALRGDRDIYDFDKVNRDKPNMPVVTVVQALMNAGYTMIAVSGRQGRCYGKTQDWLNSWVGYNIKLFMREDGDMRPDYIVKNELYEKHIMNQYNVILSIDDRNSVVDLWRNKLQIPTFQVAEGDF